MTTAQKKKSAELEAKLKAKAPKIQGFTVTIWHDATDKPFPNYTCSSCQFETLFAFKATEHLNAGVHVWKRPTKRTRKVRTDKGAVY